MFAVKIITTTYLRHREKHPCKARCMRQDCQLPVFNTNQSQQRHETSLALPLNWGHRATSWASAMHRLPLPKRTSFAHHIEALVGLHETSLTCHGQEMKSEAQSNQTPLHYSHERNTDPCFFQPACYQSVPWPSSHWPAPFWRTAFETNIYHTPNSESLELWHYVGSNLAVINHAKSHEIPLNPVSYTPIKLTYCMKSADPGLRQGRGGAWDHRRCGTFPRGL